MSGKFGKILLAVNSLATVGLIVGAVQGYGFDGMQNRDDLQLHLIYTLASTLVILFAHGWVFIYLLSLRRELGGWVQEHPVDVGPLSPRGAAISAAAALVLVLTAFLLGPASLIGSVPVWLHGLFFYVAGGAQILALFLEYRALSRSDRVLAVCAAAEAGA